MGSVMDGVWSVLWMVDGVWIVLWMVCGQCYGQLVEGVKGGV